ncbi:hypothetical protein RLO149_c005420 [Roseobacter litoralis Och 149]|uniref:Uncharacterized protein n=1 Tax=Roseobacter litoralis (strain ATCC 49566 / DSM 6996 / JCM 21268 / NBRC 15278 / OCh 149) TaxID=391595 RepID=F7ZJD8_ROSLO|nr:hypothetical protein RLO149_c005420 [Roseobacter litoralis Och 149]
MNLLDICGIAVPTSPRSDGRPGTVTILARAGRGVLAATVACEFEKGCQRCIGATKHLLQAPAPLPGEDLRQT